MNIFDLQATIGLNGQAFMNGVADAQSSFTSFSDSVTKKSASLKKAVGIITGAAAAATGAIVKTTVDAAYRADDLNTLSKQTGITTDTLQKFQYASDLIDVSMDTLTGSLRKLTMNMGQAKNGSDDISGAFDALGISVVDTEGNLRNNQEVFYEAIDALGKIENSTERDAIAMKIFGRSAQDLNPLILGGADALEELGQQAEDAGLILSQDALDGLNELSDAIDTTKATVGQFSTVFAENFAGGLADAITKVNGFTQQLITAFSEDGIAGVGATIGGMIRDSLAGSLEGLVDSESPIISTFGKISEETQQFFSDLGNVDTSPVEKIVASANDLVGAVSESASTQFSDGIGLVEDFLGAFNDAGVGEVITDVAESSAELFGTFLETSAEVISAVSEESHDFVEGFRESGAVEAIAETTKNAGKFFSTFEDTSATVIDSVGEATDRFLDGVDSHQLGESFGEYTESTANLIGEIEKTDATLVREAGSAIKSFIKNTDVEGAGEGTSKLASSILDLGTAMNSTGAETVTTFGESVEGMGARVGEVAGTYGPNIGRISASTAELVSLLTTIGTKVANVGNQIWSFFTRTLTPAVEMAAEMFIAFGGGIERVISALIRLFGDEIKLAMDIFSGDWDAVWEDVKKAWDDVKELFAGLEDAIVNPFKAINLSGVGKDMIQGFWNGVTSKWNDFTDWLDEKVHSGLIGSIMDWLGIASPSKVFAGIGKNTVLGMEVGWKDEFGNMQDEVEDSISGLTGTARIGFDASAIGRSSAAGITSMLMANGESGNGEPITINLVLDGDVAATALYDPLRNVAFQRGKGQEVLA